MDRNGDFYEIVTANALDIRRETLVVGFEDRRQNVMTAGSGGLGYVMDSRGEFVERFIGRHGVSNRPLPMSIHQIRGVHHLVTSLTIQVAVTDPSPNPQRPRRKGERPTCPGEQGACGLCLPHR